MNNQRLYFLDFARMLALFYMFFQHGVLEVLTMRHNDMITLIADFVPICSALFLYAAGFAAVISSKDDINRNVKSKLRRGIFLIAASALLFTIENGIHLPDMILASGILNTIGLFTLTTIALPFIAHRMRLPILIGWTGLLSAIFIITDTYHLYFFPFTYAYECIAPTIIFGYIGMTSALLYHHIKDKRIFHISTIITGIVILIIMSAVFGLRHCFDYTHGRYTVIRTFGADKLMVWNFNWVSFIASFGAVLLISGLCGLCENFFRSIQAKKPPLADRMLMPGQHALINYFYHLAVWAIIIVTLGFNSLSEVWFWIVLVGLYITSYPIGCIGKWIKNGLRHI